MKTKTEASREAEDRIFEALPQWIREAYRQEPMVNQVVFHGIVSSMTAEDITSEVGRAALHMFKTMREEAISRALNSPFPALFIPALDQHDNPCNLPTQ